MSILFLCTNYNFPPCVKERVQISLTWSIVKYLTDKKRLEVLSAPELQWLDFHKLMLFRHTATNNKIIAVAHFHKYL